LQDLTLSNCLPRGEAASIGSNGDRQANLAEKSVLKRLMRTT